MASAYLAGTS